MNINQLKFFVALSETLNFTQTAAELNISQPGLSRSIDALQKELNCRLFEKKGNNIKLSKAGEAFLPYAQCAITSIETGENKISSLSAHSANIINIAISLGYSMSGLQILEEFHKIHHDVEYYIIQEQMPDICQLLKEHKIDFGFSCITKDTLADEQIETLPMFVEEFSCFMGKDNELAQAAQVDLYDLKNQTFIFYSKYNQERYTRSMEEAGIKFNVFPGICSKEICFQLTAKNKGICICSNSSVYDKEHIARIPLKPTCPYYACQHGILWLKNRNFTGYCQKLLSFIKTNHINMSNV